MSKLKKNSWKESLPHWGDIIAIPCFFLIFLYYFTLPNKTLIEYLIMLFNLVTCICDILFTYLYYYDN